MNATPSPHDRAGQALLWGAGALLLWGLLPAETKSRIGTWLGELERSLRQEAQRKQAIAEAQDRQRRLEQAQAALSQLSAPPAPVPGLMLLQVHIPGDPAPVIPPAAARVPETPTSILIEPDAVWRQRIVHPSIVVILGKRGSGKSALGYRLLELCRYQLRPYVVGVPATARRLLPDWIGIAPTLEDVPHQAIALVDEAYLAYHARASNTTEARTMSQALNLSRQKGQTLIFVSQEARQVDKNIASSASVIVFKDLGILQLQFDRPELNKIAGQAQQAFAKLTDDKRRWSYVYAPDSDFMGMVENALPSFWKAGLSRLFATDAAPARARKPKTLTAHEKAERAKQLRAQGATYQEIATALGVSRPTVVNYLNGYPYRSRR